MADIATALSDPMFQLLASIIITGVILIIVIIIYRRRKGRTISVPSSYGQPYGQPQQQIGYQQNQPTAVKARGSDIKPSALNLNLETILIMVAVSAFPMAFLALYSPELFWLAMLVGLSTSLIIGIGIGFVLSTSFRVKILRRMTHRNYGFAKFVYNGNIVKPVLMDLDKDVLRFSDGVYIPGRGNMKRTVKEGAIDEITDEMTQARFTQDIKFEEGIPTIYFNIDDMLPLDFKLLGSADKTNSGDFRIPKQVAATLNKEIAVEKAKALNAIRRQADILLVICIAASICAAFFGYNVWATDQQKMTFLTKINGFVENIAAAIPALARQINPGASGG